jgi:hypothetical protein
MSSSNISNQQRPPIVKESSTSKDVAGVPSGFVLKLYQMVTGAPNDIISVSHKTSYHPSQ